MPNLIKSAIELIAQGENPIISTQVANTLVTDNNTVLNSVINSSLNSKSSSYGFKTFIDNLRTAEILLLKAKQDKYTRINTIRGIYYGTDWSVDYAVEKSKVRNTAFQVYTGTYSPPLDPRPIIGEKLYHILFEGAELQDSVNKFDFGHCIIGIDARNSFRSREIGIPTQGGTGLEIATWLGDLGGACGMLSINRVLNPKLRAITMFKGSSFGGQVNLEGDVGAFLLAMNVNEVSDPSEVLIGDNDFIADLLSCYLPIDNKSIPFEWLNRSYNFCRILGAEFSNDKSLTNRVELENRIASKIQNFGEWYMVNRLRQRGNASINILIEASSHLIGSSKEISRIFIDTLLSAIKSPKLPIQAFGNGPDPVPKGEPFQKYILLKESKNWIEKTGEWFENLW